MWAGKWRRNGAALLAAATVLMIPQQSHGDSGDIDPEADRLLRQMSEYLGGLKEFTVRTENTQEIILSTGQKLQYDTPAEASVQRPNKLRAARMGDLNPQEMYYDGEMITLYNPDDKVYATADAPGTLESALDYASMYLGLYAPGGDLLYKNSYDLLTEDVVSSFYVGQSVVEGSKCHHLAFRGTEVDWQIWIEAGSKPLPKKLVITSKWMTGAPQFSILMKEWDLSPRFRTRTFAFDPPGDAQKIEFISPAP